MQKKEALSQLRMAKSAHIQWRSYAQAIIAGIPIEKDHVPVVHTSCKFGQWYYGQGQRLSSLSSYSAIDTPHEMLHQIYMKIFKLLFVETEKSALKKIFGSSAKEKAKNIQEANDLMPKLLSVSETLLQAITMLENEIKDMTDVELAQLY